MTSKQAYLKRYYIANRERILGKMVARSRTPERKKQLHEAYKRRYSDPEYRKKILSENEEWNKANPERRRALALKARNKNVVLARHREKMWRTSDAGRAWHQARDHARRAAKLAVEVNPKSIELFICGTRAKAWVVCYYCEKAVSGKRAHFDHMVPLSKGGAHSVENLCVSCPKCNQAKLNKPIQEWMRLGQQLLNI